LNVNDCSDRDEGAGRCTKRNQWQICHADRDRASLAHQMMLDTDMCLHYADINGNLLQAARDNCCAWQSTISNRYRMDNVVAQSDNREWCGLRCGSIYPGGNERYECLTGPVRQGGREFRQCCASLISEGNRAECTTPVHGNPRVGGPATLETMLFADDEREWQSSFLRAWRKVTENGLTGVLNRLEATCPR